MPVVAPSAHVISQINLAASFLPVPKLPEMSTFRTNGSSPRAVLAMRSRLNCLQYSFTGSSPTKASSSRSTFASFVTSASLQQRRTYSTWERPLGFAQRRHNATRWGTIPAWRYSGVRSRKATSPSRRAVAAVWLVLICARIHAASPLLRT